MDNEEGELTHFGFQEVPRLEKASRVAQVFRSVAKRYDLMNDLMSLGTHRVMKLMAANAAIAREGHVILDLAGGTGDLTKFLSKHVGQKGRVCLCDINGSMLREGRDRLLNHGIVTNVNYIEADGEHLPFRRESFDSVVIGFGLRNFTSKEAALAEVLKCLKPHGRVVILEFSRPENRAVRLAYTRFAALWPKLGRAISGDEASYRYLVESIQVHPNQTELSELIKNAGFDHVQYQNILNGIVAIHEGVKT